MDRDVKYPAPPIRVYEEKVGPWKFVAHTENLPVAINPAYSRVKTYSWNQLLCWFVDNCSRDQYDIYANNETFNYHFRFADPAVAMLLRMTYGE